MRQDPGQQVHVAGPPVYVETQKKLSNRLQDHLSSAGELHGLGQDASPAIPLRLWQTAE
ncbi:MAG: hypothetical protein VB858_22490 [Planctomycetaceae bacterium]